jgi:hypothetical protein
MKIQDSVGRRGGDGLIGVCDRAVAALNTASNVAWEVNISTVKTNPAAFYGVWSNHAHHALRWDGQNELVYQFITTRFNGIFRLN